MAQVVIEEEIYNEDFVKDQTDLPLLVRTDTRTYLRGAEMKEDGKDNEFYFLDSNSNETVEAPMASLALEGVDPALTGTYQVKLKDGSMVEVTTVFELVTERLKEYTPEKASQQCGVAPDVIRKLARKVATKRTNILCSLSNAGKFYHGDLIERSELLLLGLTANWGRKGTGVRAWTGGFFDGSGLVQARERPGQDPREFVMMLDQMLTSLKAADPTLNDELANIEFSKQMATMGTGPMLFYPPAFFWYNHCGFDEIWSRKEWHDPTMKRPFREYWEEAKTKDWWQGVALPTKDQEPRVLIECGGNMLRRTRGGQNVFLKELWPKLKMVVTIDPRMSTTALYSDVVLPASQQYEKIAFGIPSSHTMNLTFGDKIVEPQGEAKNEWEIFRMLTAKAEERARRRGLDKYTDSRGMTHQMTGLYDRVVAQGSLLDEEKVADDMIRDTTITGALPEGTSLETMREKGYARWSGLGMSVRAHAQASEVKPDETFTPFRLRVEKKHPYPTLTRRAQFYIDHPWFLEADEELPCHKDPPEMGGRYPLMLTSGHSRSSIHALNIVNKMMLQTHRGQPHVLLNPGDAIARHITDGQQVKVHNDMGHSVLSAKVTETIRPGQVIIYNGWEPYQFPDWSDPANMEPGMVKWLHLAGGYGHLKYWMMEWQPCPVDRATRVEVEPYDAPSERNGKRRSAVKVR
jgi:DMSO reductase family type II enzyme molybdopterin subunit